MDTVVIKRPITDELGGNEPIGYQAIVLDPSPECTAQLLAVAVDHIDILLEDWYPTLGECWGMYNSQEIINQIHYQCCLCTDTMLGAEVT